MLYRRIDDYREVTLGMQTIDSPSDVAHFEPGVQSKHAENKLNSNPNNRVARNDMGHAPVDIKCIRLKQNG